jgi:acetyl esterase/lipase
MPAPKTIIRILAGLTFIAAGASLFALHRSARRLGISTRSQFVRAIVLPIVRPADEKGHDAMDAAIAADRAAGPAAPPAALARRFDITAETVDGHTVWTLAPRRPDNGLRLLYLHGGGYVYDLGPGHWLLAEELAARTGARVILPRYPVAPESDWQPGHDLARRVYEGLAKEAGAGHVALVGDSAGGGFALALAQTLRDSGAPLPAALVLFYPWLDVTCSDPAQPALEQVDRVLSIEMLRRAGSLWAGGLAPTDPRISPLDGDLAGLPPIAVFVGTDDLLLPDARRLAEKAQAEGASVTLHEYPHQYHGWIMGVPRLVPEARRALDQAAGFVLVRVGRA